MTNSDDARTGELKARAATQRGVTEDKIPGFDPAAAPLETDAEAGGAPYGGAADARSGEAARPAETSTGTAMRPMERQVRSRRNRAGRAAIITAFILAVALVIAVLAFVG